MIYTMHILLFLLSFQISPSIPPVEATELVVTVTDIEDPGAGTIYVMLWAEAEGFPADIDEANFRQAGKIDGAKAVTSFTDIPPGTYALTVWQDENGNGEIDRNFVGMPKEPMGLYSYGSIGRPVFKKCSLEVGSDRQRVEVKLLNQ